MTTELRNNVNAWIERVLAATSELGTEDLRDQLRAAADALGDPQVRVVVCGEWNAGKSSLINALAGVEDLLPTNVAPCTSYVTRIQRGDAERYAVTRAGESRSLDRAAFVALTAATDADPTIEALRVEHPGVWRDGDVALFDTPGLEDLDQVRSDITLDYLPNADVVVLLVDATTGLKGTEKAFVRNHLTAREMRRVVCVANRVDNLNSPDDVSRKLAACKRGLADVLPEAQWIGTSAKTGDGVEELRRATMRIARTKRQEIFAARFGRAVRPILAGLELRMASEEAGLASTLDAAQTQLAKTRQASADSQRHNDAVFDQLGQAVRADVQAWGINMRHELEELLGRLRGEVAACDSVSDLRSFARSGEVERSVASFTKSKASELEHVLQKSLARHAPSDGVRSVAGLTDWSDGDLAPEVDSIFLTLPPQLLWSLLSLVPGIGPLMRAAPLVASIFLNEVARHQIVSALQQALDEAPDLVLGALEFAAYQAMEQLFAEAQTALSQQDAAVEAGLEDALAAHRGERAAVDARRAHLESSRKKIQKLTSELNALTEGAR